MEPTESRFPRREILKALGAIPIAAFVPVLSEARTRQSLLFNCTEDNDLYRVVSSTGVAYSRYDTPQEAVARAAPDSGVLILAEGYPEKTTKLDATLFQKAAGKKLRLYVEFPSLVPRLQVGEPRSIAKGRYGNLLERVFVASDAFSPSLEKLAILDFHDGRYVPIAAANADLVLARAAGFDKAVYGLPTEGVNPILFRVPEGDVLVAATKLSQFLTGRYEPVKSWGFVWNWILQWLIPKAPVRLGEFEAVVRPSFGPRQPLPENAALHAFQKGVEWYDKAKLFVDSSWEKAAEERADLGHASPPPPPNWPVGDGSEGLLEGFSNTIEYDGSQLLGWDRRNDCMGETSMAMAFSSAISGKPRDREIAANLNDFIYFNSVLAQGPRNDPTSASYGLVGWALPKSQGVYYGDDNARSLLGTIATAALLKSDRWDELVLRCLLANLRTTGKLGFRGDRLDEKPLQQRGWRYYYNAETVNYAPHYEAYLWACFLWAYDKTRDTRFLDRTKNAIRMTMAAYPDQWRWTNGIQQERARMLLPLAWLIRIEDNLEHRQWLKRMAEELLAFQDECGALREEIGSGESHYGPPKSNDRYGTSEASLIQQNGDPACDFLYTSNFAFHGLREAAAATGDPFYSHAEDKLADFLCRIQVCSSAHPELDGAWFRAFDFKIWDYWASNADWGWGVWSIETGWTQAWITSVLAMRHLKTSLWDLTANSKIGRYMDKLLPALIPGPEGATPS
ncbi:MAG: hypothetical protein ABSA59_11250 [Terriglobia bacterium]|jgi:hypothetical protein